MELLLTRRERRIRNLYPEPQRKKANKKTETIACTRSIIQVKRRGRVGNGIPPKLKGRMWGATWSPCLLSC